MENLQGLTTLKIYQADGFKQEEMNWQAEQFRKITMKVLTMQLNSITIMDLIAYGGAALGVVLSVTQLRAGKVDLSGCLLIILLSADFFFLNRSREDYNVPSIRPSDVSTWDLAMKRIEQCWKMSIWFFKREVLPLS